MTWCVPRRCPRGSDASTTPVVQTAAASRPVYSGGHALNGVHETWLRRQRFDDTHTTAAFDHHFDAVLNATAARDRLDQQIVEIAASPRWAYQVDRLGCLRGISALTDRAGANRRDR